MAQMIPAYLPDHASQGEKAVFATLQELPDDVLVYYEPVIRRRYPDFIVIDPEAGVLVIEVKGWRAGWIKAASADDIVIQQAGHERADRHPLRQARDYQNRAPLSGPSQRSSVAQWRCHPPAFRLSIWSPRGLNGGVTE
jgi:hypothetical protein